ncbi:MAG: DUF4142 domain-containing protein [Tahibacter sp.]
MNARKTQLKIALACAIAFAAAGVASATQLSEKDAAFVGKAAIGGMAEVEQSKTAKIRAGDPKIKAFAATMVTDHGNANTTLKGLAKDNGWSLPTSLDADAKAKVSDLSEKQGMDFDRSYASNMQKDHDATVALFKDFAQNADDAALRKFATDTLPTIEHHQKMAHELSGG